MIEPRLTRAYIGLGSNLEDPRAQVERAINSIEKIPDTSLINVSSWYQSTAVGPGDQPDYINGAVSVDTYLPPESLLSALQTIEAAQGRVRNERWAARTLDLDLLLYGDIIVSTDRLQVPHPRLQERNFVLYPLAELAPRLALPSGDTLQSLVESIGTEGLSKLER